MADPIPPLTLPGPDDLETERLWLQAGLQDWLDGEYLPEPANATIASQTARLYLRHRLEGENDLGSLVVALAEDLQGEDFSQSFYGPFAVANHVAALWLDRLGIEPCCGRPSPSTSST